MNKERLAQCKEMLRCNKFFGVLEMMCDWKASSERHADGDILKSIEINQKRFGYSDDLKNILVNTAIFLKWIEVNR